MKRVVESWPLGLHVRCGGRAQSFVLRQECADVSEEVLCIVVNRGALGIGQPFSLRWARGIHEVSGGMRSGVKKNMAYFVRQITRVCGVAEDSHASNKSGSARSAERWI